MTKKRLLAFMMISTLSLCAHAKKQWAVFEDFLYWHASQETTSIWAYQFSLKDSGDQGTYFTEPNTHFAWSPGLRLGVEYKPDAYPDIKFYWTHFSSKTKDSLTAPEGQFLLPQFFNGFTTASVYNSAQLDWHIKMIMLDLKMGHTFIPLDSLTIHPSLGIKAGSINQSIHSSWQMSLFNFPLYNATEDLKNNFSGLGPSLSLDGVWGLYKGLSIRADFETALLLGRWNIEDDFHRPNSFFYPEKSIQSTTHDSLGAFMTSYFLGLEWTFKAKALVTLRAGYELQFWGNQLRLPVFQALPIHGDLTLQGGTCGIYINI